MVEGVPEADAMSRAQRAVRSAELRGIVARLNGWQPQMLIAYASMMRLLASEQLAGRLRIAPRFVFSASEVLTDSTRELTTAAWGRPPRNVYGATETSGIAAECGQHPGMHLFEDLLITEVVDEDNRPVPAGVHGAKVPVTVLFSHPPADPLRDERQRAARRRPRLPLRLALRADQRHPGQEAGRAAPYATPAGARASSSRSSYITSWTTSPPRDGRSSTNRTGWRSSSCDPGPVSGCLVQSPS